MPSGSKVSAGASMSLAHLGKKYSLEVNVNDPFDFRYLVFKLRGVRKVKKAALEEDSTLANYHRHLRCAERFAILYHLSNFPLYCNVGQGHRGHHLYFVVHFKHALRRPGDTFTYQFLIVDPDLATHADEASNLAHDERDALMREVLALREEVQQINKRLDRY